MKIHVKDLIFAGGSVDNLDLSFRKTALPERMYSANAPQRRRIFQLVKNNKASMDYLKTTGILNIFVKPIFVESVDELGNPCYPAHCSEVAEKEDSKEEVLLDEDEDEVMHDVSRNCKWGETKWFIRKQPGLSAGSFLLVVTRQYKCTQHKSWIDAGDPSMEHREGCQLNYMLRKCGSHFFDPGATECLWNFIRRPDS